MHTIEMPWESQQALQTRRLTEFGQELRLQTMNSNPCHGPIRDPYPKVLNAIRLAVGPDRAIQAQVQWKRTGEEPLLDVFTQTHRRTFELRQ